MKYNSERGHKDQERAIIKYINKIMIRYPEQILIRLEKGCNETLKRDADRVGLSVSSYVRLRLFNSDLIDLT